MRRRSLLSGLTALCLLATAPLSAQTAYSSRALFLSALTSSTTTTFEGIAAAGTVSTMGIPLTLGSFSFDTSDPLSTSFFVADGAYAGGAFSLGSGASFTPQNFLGTTDLLVTSSAPGGSFKAFGFDFGAATGTTFTVSLDGTPFRTFTFTSTIPAPQFFGFITTTAVNSVAITADAEAPVFDNFVTGTPDTTPNTSVPEPATDALFAVGLLAIGGAARRRRTR